MLFFSCFGWVQRTRGARFTVTKQSSFASQQVFTHLAASASSAPCPIWKNSLQISNVPLVLQWTPLKNAKCGNSPDHRKRSLGISSKDYGLYQQSIIVVTFYCTKFIISNFTHLNVYYINSTALLYFQHF